MVAYRSEQGRQRLAALLGLCVVAALLHLIGFDCRGEDGVIVLAEGAKELDAGTFVLDAGAFVLDEGASVLDEGAFVVELVSGDLLDSLQTSSSSGICISSDLHLS